MTARKEMNIDKLLDPGAWPKRALIGKRMVAGRDREGVVCIADIGGDIYGSPYIRQFVTLEPDELRKLQAFLAEVAR